MKPVRKVICHEEIEFFLRLHGLCEDIIQLPRPPPQTFDIDTMEPNWTTDEPWFSITPDKQTGPLTCCLINRAHQERSW